MQNFYSSSEPNVDIKNTINSVSINIRDFLLNKNLRPQYPQLSTTINGAPKIGEPIIDTAIGVNSVLKPNGLPLEVEGITFKNNNYSINQFKNDSEVSDDLVNINLTTKDTNPKYPDANWPQGNQKYPTSATDEVEKYGIIGKTNSAGFRKQNVIKNLYLDTDKQIDISTLIDLLPNTSSQQVKGYLDTYGGINLGGSIGTQTIDTIGSVLNGQGIGFAKSGIIPNFDFKSSLAGRVLGATGIINDTKLGMIGGQQLALSLANNASFNVQQEILGSLNIEDNVMSLVKDGTLAGFRSDYTITRPITTGGQIVDYTSKILGFSLPKSYLDDSASIFQSENNSVDTITRSNAMITNTGKGQNQALLMNIKANMIGISPTGIDNPSKSIFRVGYAPAYTNNKGEVEITNGVLYSFSNQGKIIDLFASDDKIIPNINYNREEKVKDSGFYSPEENPFAGHNNVNNGYFDRKISDIGFSWGTNIGGLVNSDSDYKDIIGDKKSLLTKTQELFKSKGMLNIITSKGDMRKKSTQIQQANGGGFSKGSQVLNGNLYTNDGTYIPSDRTAEDTYCRSWTTLDRYDSVNNLIRKRGLWDSPTVPYRFNIKNSVLDDYGNPKIAPYTTDKPEDPKKFMFSIENLAWSDNVADLPSGEVGDGDLISGKKGRIMWFPPYEIQFNENNTVNWESNNFIGRGEPLYTYNNTERTGTLSFKVIVDHPSYVNSFRGDDGPDDNYVASFWAGCVDPNSEIAKKLTPSQVSSLVTESLIIPEVKKEPEVQTPGIMNVYFINDRAELDFNYENGLSGSSQTLDRINYLINPDGKGFGVGDKPCDFTCGTTLTWPDTTNYGLNFKGQISLATIVDGEKYYGFFDKGYHDAIVKFLNTTGKYHSIIVTGYASPQGKVDSNKKLATARANEVVKYLKDNWGPRLNDRQDFNKKFKPIISSPIKKSGCKPNRRDLIDEPECKKDRYVSITFQYNPELASDDLLKASPVTKKKYKKVTSTITNKFYDETKYFDQLVNDDKFIFDKFREKIKYFHPAFHSTTPEGLNSRLTFLLQCTRQGPTSEIQGANNLAFGRAPVCILRIGDFYNTKIVIDNVGIDYEPLVWDLNPEGIGVQPMIANVNMSFKFIGGSTLMGPINKLQNALSFNYFANTQVYDPRADYISKDRPNIKTKIQNKDGSETDATIIQDNKSGYYITNGVKDISNPETVITEQDIADNSPEIDQLKASEEAVSGVENQNIVSEIGLTITNVNVLINGVKSEGKMDGTLDVSVSTQNITEVNGYDMKVSIFDGKNNQIQVGVGKILKDNPLQNYSFDLKLSTPKFIFSTTNKYVVRVEIVNVNTYSIIKEF